MVALDATFPYSAPLSLLMLMLFCLVFVPIKLFTDKRIRNCFSADHPNYNHEVITGPYSLAVHPGIIASGNNAAMDVFSY